MRYLTLTWRTLCVAFALAALTQSAMASVFVTEVAPWSSGNSSLGRDWFEVTNTGSSAVDITGWKMDDNSASFGSSVTLRGITSIAPGQSVIFFESNDTGTDDPANTAAFNSIWGTSFVFGTGIGSYAGSGVSLSTSSDGVNLFNSAGVVQASVSFGSSPGSSPYATFDNSALLTGSISTLSVDGLHGAYSVVDGSATLIGSPGVVPEPGTLTLVGIGLASLALVVRRRKS